jgi:predicted Rossmann-fold nucleotide-binding protein
MKLEIDTQQKVLSWIANPEPAVFQGQDLRKHSADIATRSLADCTFLGCMMEPVLIEAAAVAGCLVVPRLTGLPFDPFSPGLYSPSELFDRFDPNDPVSSYQNCLDWLVYKSYIDPATRLERPVDVDVLLMRRLHDASISEALEDLLDPQTRNRSVAIMGGHDRGRNEPIYAQTAKVAMELTNQGYLIITGGGPGLMEAGNLGAYAAGFADSDAALEQALTALSTAPIYNDPKWLSVGFDTWKAMGKPDHPEKSRSVGLPTWFYGHEPPNVFATDIAKYFENSVREEGLLAVALAGVIFAEGNGGTVQEILQDACQNYYRTYAKRKSPMILFGTDYWNPPAMSFNNPRDKRKQVYLLLHKLATEKHFDDYLLLTDDPNAIVPFIKTHPPA